jgi:hypothetical protein
MLRRSCRLAPFSLMFLLLAPAARSAPVDRC